MHNIILYRVFHRSEFGNKGEKTPAKECSQCTIDIHCNVYMYYSNKPWSDPVYILNINLMMMYWTNCYNAIHNWTFGKGCIYQKTSMGSLQEFGHSMIHDNRWSYQALVPGMIHSIFCPVNFQWPTMVAVGDGELHDRTIGHLIHRYLISWVCGNHHSSIQVPGRFHTKMFLGLLRK